MIDPGERAGDLEDLWAYGQKPAELEAEGARVVPWTVTDNGERLYRLDRSGLDPDRWTVVVNETRGARWEHFSVSRTRFLASALSGEPRPGVLSSSFPRVVHEFRRPGPA
ncbi:MULTISPECIES: hypothetical protein [unclassified Streptomyces]|uniref:hypothetical protein n=1 Tax=unclassified Streptomyces TaxID=2593676 RepID=UPI0006AF5EEA|nr:MULTISPECIES: hypothetical protein [unclassified Streptomyces]